MTSSQRRVLVTGGAGFIASHVADAHLAHGDQVWIVDNLSSGRRENLPSGAEFVEMDVGDPALRDLFREIRFDLVNHHAAQIDVRVSVEDPARDALTNIFGFLNVAEAALETEVGRMVFISSGGVVYGEPDQIPTDESAAKLPLSPYGVTKLAAEQYLHYYRKIHGMESVALRYSNVYGPRQDPHGEAGVVSIFSTRLLDSQSLTVFGDGEQTRDYVFVKDVARANVLASELTLEDGVGLDSYAFNVGTGVATSVNRLADLLEEVAGVSPGREYHNPRAGELQHSALDASKLRSRGWSPRSDLRDGLRDTFEHISAVRAAT